MFDHPALSQQIITYLGNKRRLLPFIWQSVTEILRKEGWEPRLRRAPQTPRGEFAPRAEAAGGEEFGPRAQLMPRAEAAGGEEPPLAFVDAFAGSGVVSRMARLAGFEVVANDLEPYCEPLLRPFLELEPEGVDALFAPVAGGLGLRGVSPYAETLTWLNHLEAPDSPEKEHFARHYAPRQTAAPDLDGERLFYSRENALRIDAILAALEGEPFAPPLVRETVLASLLYEMSVHINTSGVMKGFHRGWGGRRGDALARILGPIELRPLPLIGGPRGEVTTLAAEELFEQARVPEAQIIYADPPYTVHQYGANYHLLNTATLADRYDPGPLSLGSRAGIRRDHNRSDFCRSTREGGVRACEAAFERFVRSARGRYLLVSYNTDGLIPPERMVTLLSRSGRNRVEARVQDHVKFRGGKNTQSERKTREVLYTVELDRPAPAAQTVDLIGRLEREERLSRLLDSYIDPRRLPWGAQRRERGQWLLTDPEGVPILTLRRDFRLLEVYPAGRRSLHRIEAARVEKREVMERYIEEGMVREALELLPSFKIEKYRHLFERYARLIETLASPEERSKVAQLESSYGFTAGRARRS
ncbi:MAG: DNA adenine methylase [Alkalispirochaetaceae bacterium]